MDALIENLATTTWIVVGGLIASTQNYKMRVMWGRTDDRGIILNTWSKNFIASGNLYIGNPARMELDDKKGFMKLFDAAGKALLVLQNAEMRDARIAERRRRELADAPRQRLLARQRQEEMLAQARAERCAKEMAERPKKLAELLEQLNREYSKGVIKFVAEGEGNDSELKIELPDGTRFSPFGVGCEWLYANGGGVEVY